MAEKLLDWSPYNYGYNDPIRFLDPDGRKPTPQEAAAIAAHVYGDQPDKILLNGWRPSKVGNGYKLVDEKTGLKSRVYERMTKSGKMEYVYATAGTENLTDWVNNIEQLWGGSDQYRESVSFATKLSKDLENSELTFVGHSKGGGQASADALATGRDAITFNSAGLSSATKNALQLYQEAKIDSYEVHGEIVGAAQGILGIFAEGKVHIVGGKTVTKSYFDQIMSTAVSYTDPIAIHNIFNSFRNSVNKHKKITADK